MATTAGWIGGFLSTLVVTGCSVTRPIAVGPDASALADYLAEHPAANVRVQTRSGERYWIHAPQVRGDSIVGRQGYDLPARPAGLPLTEVAEIGTSRFSAGRTGAAIGGAVAAVGVALLVLVDGGSQVVY